MTKSLLNKLCVLELNKNWFPVTLKTPKKVFENFCTGNLLALDISYDLEDIANEDYSNPIDMTPMKWEDWIKLPIRDYDLSIRTARSEIRIPNIVICAAYNKIPDTTPKLSKKNIMLRDGYICQFSGRTYPKNELNIDHVVPRSRGGQNTWENLVTCHKSINTKKANKTPKEAGLSLVRTPRRPSTASLFFADKFRDPKWNIFLKHLD